MKRLFLFFLLFISFFSYSNVKDWSAEELKARSLLNQGKIDDAIVLFREITISSDNEIVKMESYYWLGLAYLNTGKYKIAEYNLEYYLRQYGNKGKNFIDAQYQRGANFFLLEKYQESIAILDKFIKDYPKYKTVPNAYYWLGECFYALGRFDDAIVYFTIVTDKYPGTNKYEASVFKLRLIDHKKTELVLQNIIKWSNEQYLSSINQFKINEMSLLQALEDLRSGVKNDPQIEKELRKENELLRQRISELEKNGQVTSSTSGISDFELSEKAKQLELRAKLLDRKEQALNLLEQQLRVRENINE